MAELLIRSVSLRLRDDGAGDTVYGRVVPYGPVAVVDDGAGPYREQFAPGAFTRSLAERSHKIKLHVMHDGRRLPIGRATSLVETPDGVNGEFKISATRDGNDALELVRDGAVDAFSIGFRSIRSEQRAGVTVRVEAALREVSLVGNPAYEGAAIAGVRSATSPTIPVEAAQQRLDLLRKAFFQWPHH